MADQCLHRLVELIERRRQYQRRHPRRVGGALRHDAGGGRPRPPLRLRAFGAAVPGGISPLRKLRRVQPPDRPRTSWPCRRRRTSPGAVEALVGQASRRRRRWALDAPVPPECRSAPQGVLAHSGALRRLGCRGRHGSSPVKRARLGRDGRCARRSPHPRPVVGHRGPARRAAPRRAGRRRHQGRAARRRPVPRRTPATRSGTGRGARSPSTSSGRTGSRRSCGSPTTPTCSSRRSGPASPTGSASGSTRCTSATRASSTARAPRTPRVTACAHGPATTRSSRRAAGSSGSSRAGGWARSSCTCRCRAWARCSSSRPGSSPRSFAPRGDRPRPARAHVAVPGRAALHDADLAARRARAAPTSTA